MLKALRGFLVLVALLLSIVPPAFLVDLLNGGTGYGLCPEGLAACSTAYLTGPTFALRILGGLLLVMVGIRLLSRIIGQVETSHLWDQVADYYDNLREGTATER